MVDELHHSLTCAWVRDDVKGKDLVIRRVDQIVEQSGRGCAHSRNALKGIRIPVFGLKGQRPGPLDDEGAKVKSI